MKEAKGTVSFTVNPERLSAIGKQALLTLLSDIQGGDDAESQDISPELVGRVEYLKAAKEFIRLVSRTGRDSQRQIINALLDKPEGLDMDALMTAASTEDKAINNGTAIAGVLSSTTRNFQKATGDGRRSNTIILRDESPTGLRVWRIREEWFDSLQQARRERL